jgi:hypothetical protein
MGPEEVYVYPNPVSESLFFSAGQEKIFRLSIVDLHGREVFDFMNVGSQFSIPTAELEAGLYFLRANTRDRVYSLKFLKKN